jgi:hypothetical protein
MHAVAEDGRNRKLFCVDLATVPMWLAGLQASRVRAEVRNKLVRYQREAEASGVLAAWSA